MINCNTYRLLQYAKEGSGPNANGKKYHGHAVNLYASIEVLIVMVWCNEHSIEKTTTATLKLHPQ